MVIVMIELYFKVMMNGIIIIENGIIFFVILNVVFLNEKVKNNSGKVKCFSFFVLLINV